MNNFKKLLITFIATFCYFIYASESNESPERRESSSIDPAEIEADLESYHSEELESYDQELSTALDDTNASNFLLKINHILDLIASGANVNLKSLLRQKSALITIATHGTIEDLESLFIDYPNIDVNVVNKEGDSALHKIARSFALDSTIIEKCHFLYRSNIARDVKNKFGNSPVHELLENLPFHEIKGCALVDQSRAIRILISMILNRENINLQNNEGNTPLHIAASKGANRIVTLLLIHGADKTIKNNNGDTPYDVAKQRGFKTCAECLK